MQDNDNRNEKQFIEHNLYTNYYMLEVYAQSFA